MQPRQNTHTAQPRQQWRVFSALVRVSKATSNLVLACPFQIMDKITLANSSDEEVYSRQEHRCGAVQPKDASAPIIGIGLDGKKVICRRSKLRMEQRREWAQAGGKSSRNEILHLLQRFDTNKETQLLDWKGWWLELNTFLQNIRADQDCQLDCSWFSHFYIMLLEVFWTSYSLMPWETTESNTRPAKEK